MTHNSWVIKILTGESIFDSSKWFRLISIGFNIVTHSFIGLVPCSLTFIFYPWWGESVTVCWAATLNGFKSEIPSMRVRSGPWRPNSWSGYPWMELVLNLSWHKMIIRNSFIASSPILSIGFIALDFITSNKAFIKEVHGNTAARWSRVLKMPQSLVGTLGRYSSCLDKITVTQCYQASHLYIKSRSLYPHRSV